MSIRKRELTPYDGPVYFDSDKGSHFSDQRFFRRRRLVCIDGKYFHARRRDPSHQKKHHQRYLDVTPS